MLARLREAAKPRPSTVLSLHRSEIVKLAEKYHASNLRVFGSVARGEDRPGSDVDLLVCFDADATLYDQVELAEEIEGLLGVPVDVVSEAGLRDRHQGIRSEARAL